LPAWAGTQLLPESYFDQFVKVAVSGNMKRSSSTGVQGQQGSALYFDGVGDEVVILDAFAPPLQGTIALWMKPELRGTLMQVLGGSDSFEILVNGFDRIVNQLFAASQSGLESEAPLTDDTWRHVAVTYDYVTGQQQIYLDGELAGSHPSLANADPVSFRLTLGNRIDMHEHFRGVLDDIRMYDSVLRLECTIVCSVIRALQHWSQAPP
jgi:hypothetical protein